MKRNKRKKKSYKKIVTNILLVLATITLLVVDFLAFDSCFNMEVCQLLVCVTPMALFLLLANFIANNIPKGSNRKSMAQVVKEVDKARRKKLEAEVRLLEAAIKVKALNDKCMKEYEELDKKGVKLPDSIKCLLLEEKVKNLTNTLKGNE